MKRFVSYIYSMNDDHKADNCGFARIEIRSGRNRVDIHLKDRANAGKKGTVYLFLRNGENIQGILLGDFIFKEEKADYRYERMEDTVGATPYRIDQLQGLLIMVDGRIAYLSKWDEKPVNLAGFQLWENEGQKAEAMEPEKEADRGSGVTGPKSGADVSITGQRPNAEASITGQKASADVSITGQKAGTDIGITDPKINTAAGTRQRTNLKTGIINQMMNLKTNAANPVMGANPDVANPPIDTKADAAKPAINTKPDATKPAMNAKADAAKPAMNANPDVANPSINAKSGASDPVAETKADLPDTDADTKSGVTQTGINTYIRTNAAEAWRNARRANAAGAGKNMNARQYITGRGIHARQTAAEAGRKEEKEINAIPAVGKTGEEAPAEPTEKETTAIPVGGTGKETAAAPSERAGNTMPAADEAKEETISMRTAEVQPRPAADSTWEQNWRYLLRTCPVLHEFSEEEQALCVRVELKDLRLLPQKYRGAMNNSFLLHGFFNYHYLILGRKGTNWILGVPGIFQNQEHVVASVFGFPEFLAQAELTPRGERMGYWYRTLL